ncbi:uncharacterized protein LOC126622799 [Malus sylvestris]|uniref:uncharacterized protein LOC126622799 n=1 Tax=Malus sylvestris TaxID=3752 RepID=UPI0021AC1401|nr:uncharacterized protein LOC126622799 [Malus sylvestris]
MADDTVTSTVAHTPASTITTCERRRSWQREAQILAAATTELGCRSDDGERERYYRYYHDNQLEYSENIANIIFFSVQIANPTSIILQPTRATSRCLNRKQTFTKFATPKLKAGASSSLSPISQMTLILGHGFILDEQTDDKDLEVCGFMNDKVVRLQHAHQQHHDGDMLG